MKQRCLKCGAAVPPDSEAYICSYECTYCAACAAKLQNVCNNCGGELVRRPRRSVASTIGNTSSTPRLSDRLGLTLAVSLVVWAFVALATSATLYEMYRMVQAERPFAILAGVQFSDFLTYVPLTPLVFALAIRFPLQRNNWRRRSVLHLSLAIGFAFGHIVLKSFMPYGYWDPISKHWDFGVWDSHLHHFRALWPVFRSMFFFALVEDVTGAYVPIALIAHVISYYRSLQEREMHATQLEAQLAKARLQALKSQLQPHFLFNTMHSISALMLTDVKAADRMMARLSDLLRLSLESDGTQVTTLGREIEFLNGYLEIEKARFEERLNVAIEVAPDCLDAQVPHLLLQPLVENAVRHGISRVLSGGEIEIVAKQEGPDLEILVRDNGPGLLQPYETSKRGLGLTATQERLRTLYGREQNCEISNRREGGVEVKLHIPFITQIRKEESAKSDLGADDKTPPESLELHTDEMRSQH